MNKNGSDVTGGCQCDAVRYRLLGPAKEIYACHCGECRKQSASAFGLSVIVQSRLLEHLQGELKQWSRSSDSGQQIDCFFCPACGTRLWHGNPQTEQYVSVKGGSLDQPVDLSEAAHIWTSRALPGIAIPENVPISPKEPE